MLGLATLLLHIDEVAALVRTGVTTAQAVMAAINDGRAKVHDAAGRELVTAEELDAEITVALGRWHRAADAAAARIERRAAADGTGHP